MLRYPIHPRANSLLKTAGIVALVGCGASETLQRPGTGSLADASVADSSQAGQDGPGAIVVSDSYVAPESTVGLPGDGNCAAVAQKAELVERPADIIWVIDNSGSMSSEIDAVRANMNAFASALQAAGVDAHVVLISSDSAGYLGICVEAPLGSGSCPDDSKPPQFLHVNQVVGSNDELVQIINTFPKWYQVLRPSSVKSFVVVTDDESRSMTGATFIAKVRDLWPKYPHAFDDWTMSGAYCRAGELCSNCAAAGSVYESLRVSRGGIYANLCLAGSIFEAGTDALADVGVDAADVGSDAASMSDAGVDASDAGMDAFDLADASAETGDLFDASAEGSDPAEAGTDAASSSTDASDAAEASVDATVTVVVADASDAAPVSSNWSDIFLRLASAVAVQTKVTCDWAIPASTNGTIDPGKVNVQLTTGAGAALTIGKVPPGADCVSASGGWHYDDALMPTRVRLCPSTCNTVRADPASSIAILFGCQTIEGRGIQ